MSENLTSPNSADFFDRNMADHYDERNSRLSPIADCLHFLLRLVLSDSPDNARILCIGVGTGADILALAGTFPNGRFVAVDPSADMLAVCQQKLDAAGVLNRCELVHGYVEAVADREFDIAVSLFVAHFVSRADRPGFYAAIQQRLRPGGAFVSAEICYDLHSSQYPSMLEHWKTVQTLMGATPESLDNLPDVLRNTLTVLSPAETDTLVQSAGFNLPVWFFQAVMIQGWYALRE